MFTLFVPTLTCRHGPHPHWLRGRHIGDPRAKDRRAWCRCWGSLFCNPVCRPPDTWPGLEKRIASLSTLQKCFKSPFMDPVLAIPQLKSLSLCLCSRLISCNIINNKNRETCWDTYFSLKDLTFYPFHFHEKLRSFIEEGTILLIDNDLVLARFSFRKIELHAWRH